jgi:hypothetical protein
MRKISNVEIEATAFHQCGGAMGSVTVLMVLMKKTVQSLKQVSTFLACQLNITTAILSHILIISRSSMLHGHPSLLSCHG